MQLRQQLTWSALERKPYFAAVSIGVVPKRRYGDGDAAALESLLLLAST